MLQITWSASPAVRPANKLVGNILAGDNVSVNKNAMNFSICHYAAYLQVVGITDEFVWPIHIRTIYAERRMLKIHLVYLWQCLQ